MLQDEAAEGAAQPGESGNDSGISDAGEHTEAVKDVFDLTLDKMEGILSKADSTQMIKGKIQQNFQISFCKILKTTSTV